MPAIEFSGTAKVTLDASIRVSLWSWTSIRHAQTAVLMAKKCEELEHAAPTFADGSPEREAASAEHWAAASSSLVASVMFLESHINELFLSVNFSQELKTPDAAGNHFPLVGGLLSDRDKRKLADTWKMIENASLLDKYVFVLHLLGKDSIDKSGAAFQRAALLVKARNELVHSKPGEHEVGRELKRLEAALRDNLGGKGFNCHPYTGEGNAFFPNQFLGFVGCRWSWETADTFAQEFRSRLGIDPAYQEYRQNLIL